MPRLPPDPIAPREFFEDIIPSLFAELDLDERGVALDLKLGVALTGEGGGEWTLHFIEGELGIASGLAEDCTFTVRQSLEDWRSALWEGRPRLVADAVELISKGDPAAGLRSGGPSNPEALRELERLPGRIDAIIEGADLGEPDWSIAVQIGAGPISPAPNATIRIAAGEAELLRRGGLHPLEALISGQLRLEGDLGLILQLQAIAMAAALPAPRKTMATSDG